MKFRLLIPAAALLICLISGQANAFFRHHHCCEPTCCEPTCCEPTCCEPVCAAEPTCCAAEPTCCEAPSCCEPCCRPRCFHKFRHWLKRCCRPVCCEPSCCEPTCCEAPAPSCGCGH